MADPKPETTESRQTRLRAWIKSEIDTPEHLDNWINLRASDEPAYLAHLLGLKQKGITQEDVDTLHKAVEAEHRKRRKIRSVEPDEGGAPPQQPRAREDLLQDTPTARTEMGNCRRLLAKAGQDLLYCKAWRRWIIWDGIRWCPDEHYRARLLAKETVLEILDEAKRHEEEAERKALFAWAYRSQTNAMVSSVLALAEPERAIAPEDLDRNPWAFNVLNGTIDLRTGEIGPHRREDRITKVAPVMFDPNAQAPNWLAFITQSLAENQNLVEFLQRAVGLALSGWSRERCLFILWGTGRNGKTTLIETLHALVGEYGVQTAAETLMQRKADTGNATPELARLKGARFVSATETEQGQRMAEARVKALTGGDTIVARPLYGDIFEFRPEFKIFLATNHKPVIRGADNGIWDRLKLIPFTVRVPDSQVDPTLPDRLREELPGILTWAVQGCIAYIRDGLGIPSEVRQAGDTYRAEMDVIGAFLEERCVCVPSARTTAADIYHAYSRWAEASGEFAISKRAFGLRLSERGFLPHRGAGGAAMWTGIGFASDVSDVSDV